VKAERSEGLKNDRAKLNEKLEEHAVSHVKQREATTAVTNPDWQSNAQPLEAGQARRAQGKARHFRVTQHRKQCTKK
jgi:hypothetical protein